MLTFFHKWLKNKLTSPWAEQREQKAAAVNAQLLDLVKCKEVILSHGKELEERNLFKLGISKQNSARDYIYLNSAIQAFNIWARVWVDSGKVSL